MNTFALLAAGTGIFVALSATPCLAQSTYEPYTFTTLAGGGGYSAEESGSVARFNEPFGVAVDDCGIFTRSAELASNLDQHRFVQFQ